ncbi:MAG: orotidine-5'-phosphate decarboxylase [Fibrobacterota bacterium]
MFLDKLTTAVKKNNSLLCVGLDFDSAKTPAPFQGDPLGYNKIIIEATSDLVCAYKPNMAFYEALGIAGLVALEKTIAAVPSHIPVILDAKRGDIGNTSAAYARAAFEWLGADAITVAPYMGRDSVEPFLRFKGKGVFVLCLTSNPGSCDFQKLKCGDRFLYLEVAEKCNAWAREISPEIGLVVGATQDEIAEVRAVTRCPFLIPGVGAQGGDLKKAVQQGGKNGALAIINASRSIIYPAGTGDPATRIRQSAHELKDEINRNR